MSTGIGSFQLLGVANLFHFLLVYEDFLSSDDPSNELEINLGFGPLYCGKKFNFK